MLVTESEVLVVKCYYGPSDLFVQSIPIGIYPKVEDVLDQLSEDAYSVFIWDMASGTYDDITEACAEEWLAINGYESFEHRMPLFVRYSDAVSKYQILEVE